MQVSLIDTHFSFLSNFDDSSPMATIQQLPYEILVNIFRSVLGTSNRKRHLLHCAYVCHSWYLPVCHVLYEKITILSRARLMTCLGHQRTNLGTFCREIELNDGSYVKKPLSRGQYGLLFSYMPHLQKVKIGPGSVYTDLRQLARNVNPIIPHLKDFTIEPMIPSHDLTQDYYNCVSAHKQTIQHLKLIQPGHLITASDGRTEQIYKFLSDFTSLTSLHIKIFPVRGLEQLSMFHVMHLCPNLIKFDWMNDFKEPDIDENNCQFNHSRLKDLNISAREINVQHSESIVKKLTGLKRLDVTVGSPAYWISRKTYDLDQLHRWQSNFSRIEEFYFILYDKINSSITDYWLLIDGINSSNPSTSIHITTVVTFQNARLREAKVKLHKRAKCTSFYYEMDVNELILWGSDNSSISLQSPLIPADINSKSMIQTYEVHCKPHNRDEEQLLYKLRPSMLPSALKSFPNIRYFNVIIYSQFDPWLEPKYQIAVVSSEIDFYNVCADKLTLPTMKISRNTHDASKRLAYVTLKGIRSPEEFGMIINLLPNLQYLNLLESFIDLDDNFNVTLDLDTLRLKLFLFDLTTLASSYSGRRTIVLQIEEEEINRKHYYKWKRESKKFTEMTFLPISEDFLQKYGRFTSRYCNIVIIKTKKVEQMVVSSKSDYLQKRVQTTVNFSLQ